MEDMKCNGQGDRVPVDHVDKIEDIYYFRQGAGKTRSGMLSYFVNRDHAGADCQNCTFNF